MRIGMGRRWLWISVLSVLVLLAFVPAITSFAAQWGLSHYLRDLGAESVEIEELWLNPFSGVGRLNGLHYRADGADYHLAHLNFNVQWWGLKTDTIHLAELSLTDANISVSQSESGLQVMGLLVPNRVPSVDESLPEAQTANDKEPALWQFKIDQLNLEQLGVEVNLPALKLAGQLQSFSIEGLMTGSAVNSTASQETPSKTPPSTKTALNIDLNHLQMLPSVTSVSGHYAVEGDLSLNQTQQGWQLQWDATSVISHADVQASNVTLTAEQIQIPLQLRADFRQEMNVSIASQLSVTDLQVQSSGVSVALAKASLPFDGYVKLGERLDYSWSFQPQFKQLLVSELNSELHWLSWDNLSAQGSLSPREFLLDYAELNNGKFLNTNKQPAFIEGVHLAVDTVVFPMEDKTNGVTVENIQLHAGDIQLRRDTEGTVQPLQPFLVAAERFSSSATPAEAKSTAKPKSSESSQAESSSRAESESSPVPVTIKKLVVDSGVKVSFEDHAVNPVFKETLNVQNVVIDQLQWHDAQAMSSLSLQAHLNHGSSVNLEGEINLKQLQVEVKGELQRYQLLSLSGYSKMITGYALSGGELGLTSQVKIAQKQLNIQNNLLFDSIAIRAQHQAQMSRFAHDLAMPLDNALDLLRDGDDQISLSVPITGDLSNPDINIQNIINKALGGAVKKASMALLSSFLQPYSTIWSVASYAGEQVTRIRFEPVGFEPGSVDMTNRATDYTNKLGQLFKDKESLEVKLCGQTSLADVLAMQQRQDSSLENLTLEAFAQQEERVIASSQALSDELHELALERAAQVKQILLDKGASQSQFKMCLPEHSNKPDSKGGVVLNI